MGSKLSPHFSREELLRCSELLQETTFVAGDFAEALDHVRPGNFVYLDPPYAVRSRRIFCEYGKSAFDPSDISRFAKALNKIVQAGADFLVSYADCREARALARQWNSLRLPIRRNIAGFADARRDAYEWLITNVSRDRIPDKTTWQT